MRKLVQLTLLAAALPGAALAQDKPGWRYRLSVGPAIGPRYPGADAVTLRPLLGLTRARGDTPFAFSAPDQSAQLALVDRGGFAFGPVVNFVSKRRARDVGASVPEVGFTPELGGFVQAQVGQNFRLRAEARQGIGGHKGLIGVLGADYFAREGDEWLISAGPRVTLVGDRYARSYFSVSNATTLRTGIPTFNAGGGLEAVGGAASALKQLSPRWGVTGYVKYDRLVDDPGNSPLVGRYGSRNQYYAGIGLSYTFRR